jgi:peptidoglycan/xylan/chitin deacetylase (PgdA/CDA1 family)
MRWPRFKIADGEQGSRWHPRKVVSAAKAKFVAATTAVIVVFIFTSGIADSSDAGPLYVEHIVEAGRYRMEYAYRAPGGLLGEVQSLFAIRNQIREDVSQVRVAIPILVYHGILNEADGSDINITHEEFIDQMFALKRAGYETISISELYEFVEGRTTNFPEKPIMITFDDGRLDSFLGADPVLRALNYHAVMFAISRYNLGDAPGYYISRSQLEYMARSPHWDIEAHGRDGHIDSMPIGPDGESGRYYGNFSWIHDEERFETPNEYRGRVDYDLSGSKQDLERVIDRDVRAFAFPYGDFGQNNTEDARPREILLAQAGQYFDLLFYQQAPGIFFSQNYIEFQDSEAGHLMRRIQVESGMDGEALVRLLENGSLKDLPYHDDFSENRGWTNAWGRIHVEGGQLVIRAQPGLKGASTILDGTGDWRNYELSAGIESPTHTGVTVWVRFESDKNNAACNFANDFIHAEEVVNGQKRVIQGVRGPGMLPEGAYTVGVRVTGRTLECIVNGQVAVQTDFIDPSLVVGGIGFKTWDSEVPENTIFVNDLKVNFVPESNLTSRE